jgi:type IV secretion system protein VirB9
MFALLLAGPAWPDNVADQYFSDPDPDLTAQEVIGLAASQNWQAASGNSMPPAPGPDGSIRFLFGASQPSIVCAVLQVCDLELQAGEQVNSLHLGDAARWNVEAAITGSGPHEVQHIILKPMDVGLNTSLIITTDRRTYHLRLRSTRSDYMPRVAFTYLDDAKKQLDLSRARQELETARSVIPETSEYLGNLDFKYRIEGDGQWKPLRVYNDGQKTILEMPQAMRQSEAPALMVLHNGGNLMEDEEMGLVNYRLQDNRYVVDSLFDKALLVSGVGSNQDRIIITRGD